MARGRWKALQTEARARRSAREAARAIEDPPPPPPSPVLTPLEDLYLADRRPFNDGTDEITTRRLERFARLRREIEAAPRANWPTSGDPNIIGEHEVAPVRCDCCDAVIPWQTIKGWRN